MIRINLLVGDRQRAARSARFDTARQLTALCGLMVVAAVSGVGFWYWSLSRQSQRLDTQIAAAQRESARLNILLAEVKTLEERRTTLQQRVQLIERLRHGQTVPVQLLNLVSRSLPDMLWLTDLKQEGHSLMLEGTSTTLVGLSDFVGNLGASSLLRRPVELVDSQVEAAAASAQNHGPDLVHFTVRAALDGLPDEEERVDTTARKGKR